MSSNGDKFIINEFRVKERAQAERVGRGTFFELAYVSGPDVAYNVMCRVAAMPGVRIHVSDVIEWRGEWLNAQRRDAEELAGTETRHHSGVIMASRDGVNSR